MIDDKEVPEFCRADYSRGAACKVVLRFCLGSAGAVGSLFEHAGWHRSHQIDYSDYRDVSGVKMPFRWVVTWTDGRSTIELSELRANIPIDAAKFAKPAPAAPRL